MKNLHTFEEFLNESEGVNVELEGNDLDSMMDAISFLSNGMGFNALSKELKGKNVFVLNALGFAHPKRKGMYQTPVKITTTGSTKITIDQFKDSANKVLDDHGYDKYKIKFVK
jgi:hypothetical protein